MANLVLSPGHSTLAERWMDLQIILLAARTCFLDRDPLIVDAPPHGCSLANSDRDKVHAFDRPTWRSPSSGAESAVLPSVRPSYQRGLRRRADTFRPARQRGYFCFNDLWPEGKELLETRGKVKEREIQNDLQALSWEKPCHLVT